MGDCCILFMDELKTLEQNSLLNINEENQENVLTRTKSVKGEGGA